MELDNQSSVDLPGLQLAMEQNLAEHACHLHRHLDDATVTETDDLVIADSGLSDDTFNIVAAARFTATSAPTRVAETLQALGTTERPFSWWVGPASAPDDLAHYLEKSGLEASETESGMWKDLRGNFPEVQVDGLEIRLVRTPEELADYATVLSANWNPPAITVKRFYADASDAALAADSPARYLVGYVDGRAVCSAEVFFSDGVAGIYNTQRSNQNAAKDTAEPSPWPQCVLRSGPVMRPQCCRRLRTGNRSIDASDSPHAVTSPSTLYLLTSVSRTLVFETFRLELTISSGKPE